MNSGRYQSWGRYPATEQTARPVVWRDDRLPVEPDEGLTFLPFGNGRSYGDVCLNDGGVLLDCRSLDRFISFDEVTGVLRCEAGVLLSEVLRLTVPKGWFLSATPGTQFATIGGAIANDVHGKNHHDAGTFGSNVRRFELLRTDGSRLLCSPSENAEMFCATIGGLGLTGVVVWAEVQLRQVNNAFVDFELIRYANLDEFFELARESDRTFEHTVAWVDCLAGGDNLGRGLFMRGNPAQPVDGRLPKVSERNLRFPFDPPFTLVNSLTLKAFNYVYYHKQISDSASGLMHYRKFFYPLDSIQQWNRIYGSKGFFQYQCVIPLGEMEFAIREILAKIAKENVGSFLAVLKLFGSKQSPGLLSFPMPGATLALDFPNAGDKTLRFLDELDEITLSGGGRVNPSKDARMSAKIFQAGFPNWTQMENLIDPRISSSFWRRVTGGK